MLMEESWGNRDKSRDQGVLGLGVLVCHLPDGGSFQVSSFGALGSQDHC